MSSNSKQEKPKARIITSTNKQRQLTKDSLQNPSPFQAKYLEVDYHLNLKIDVPIKGEPQPSRKVLTQILALNKAIAFNRWLTKIINYFILQSHDTIV